MIITIQPIKPRHEELSALELKAISLGYMNPDFRSPVRALYVESPVRLLRKYSPQDVMNALWFAGVRVETNAKDRRYPREHFWDWVGTLPRNHLNAAAILIQRT